MDPLCLPKTSSAQKTLEPQEVGPVPSGRVDSGVEPPPDREGIAQDTARARSRESGSPSADRGAHPDPRRRLRLGVWDRGFWVVVSQGWAGRKEALAIVQPATVIRWHRDGFRRFWTRRSRKQRPGRPGLDREIVSLIRRMSQANVTWSARIHNESAKLGIEVAVSTVAKYMLRRRGPPSSTWRAFLDNHLEDLVALGFFAVPTATFGVLFGLIVVAHHRRRVLHFNVTANPTAEWTARQVIHAFPEETAPPFLVRDRDKIYGERYRRAVEVLGIEDIVTAARSPWQNP